MKYRIWLAAANQVPPDKLSLCGQPARQRSCVQVGRKRGAKFIRRHGLQAMSIHKAIDQIVEAFIPEMERISRMNEGEEQKERHYKAWLRARCKSLPMTCGRSKRATRQSVLATTTQLDSALPCIGRSSSLRRQSGGSHERDWHVCDRHWHRPLTIRNQGRDDHSPLIVADEWWRSRCTARIASVSYRNWRR
jgi:hypothetical protein